MRLDALCRSSPRSRAMCLPVTRDRRNRLPGRTAPAPNCSIRRALLRFAPKTFAQSAPLQSQFRSRRRESPAGRQRDRTRRSVTVGSRPDRAEHPAAHRRARPASAIANPEPPLQAMARSKPRLDDPFEKLFGKRASSRTGSRLRGAGRRRAQRWNERSRRACLPPNDGLTAIYDITARTVYMPDGTKLEAHSGLGAKMDDPRHVHVRMHGATPPHVYDLDAARSVVPRRGGAADAPGRRRGGDLRARTGLLTHTYLLGPNGDSNGCVSFKDYDDIPARVQGRQGQAHGRRGERRRSAARSARRGTARPRSLPGHTGSRPGPLRSPQDDRYLPAFSSSLASRTSSSARSLNSSPE